LQQPYWYSFIYLLLLLLLIVYLIIRGGNIFLVIFSLFISLLFKKLAIIPFHYYFLHMQNRVSVIRHNQLAITALIIINIIIVHTTQIFIFYSLRVAC
jgi:hypothetical protein